MKPPYGLAADLHLHAWSAFSKPNEQGMNNRLAGLLSEIERCCKEVHDAGGKKVVFAGDVFHVRGSVVPTVLNSARDTLARCHQIYGTEFVILAGNHDLEGRDSERLSSAITALETPFVRVVNEPTVDKGMVLIPWIENIEQLKTTIEAMAAKWTASEIDLILHAPIDGVIEGLPAHGLTPEWLASLGFKRVFSGHYHNHKAFDGGVYSIGALAHHSWSDVGSRAGFLLVEDTKVNWRKSHLPEFIDLGKAAEYCEPEDLPGVVDRNYVRVRVDAEKAKEVEEARKELLDMGALAVLVQATPKPPLSETRTGATVQAGAALETSVADFIAAAADKMQKAGTDATEAAKFKESVTAAALKVLADVDASLIAE